MAVAVVGMYKLYPDTLPETAADMTSLSRALVAALARATVPTQASVTRDTWSQYYCDINVTLSRRGAWLSCGGT